ncbi:MAG: LPXTG cell wall anchor domain-containing protein, partial [Pseudolysinimonas sp.]
YTLQFSGSVPNPQTFDFTATAPALAATGVPTTPTLLIAFGLLFAGLALAAIAVRRRSRAN